MTADCAFETILNAFEQSWRDGTTPSIEVTIQDASRQLPKITRDERCHLLARLIRLDLEYRWRRQQRGDGPPDTPGSESATVLFFRDMLLERYLDRFPELREQTQIVVQLAVVEYRTRCLNGARPSHEEYRERFPDYPQIADGLRREDHELKSRPEVSGKQSFVRLAVTDGPHAGESLEINRFETILVGRSPDAQLQLHRDTYFSRYHLQLEVNPPDCRLLDLQSANGTFVNEQRVTEAFLKNGDEISGGETRISVTITSERRTLPELASTRQKPVRPPTEVEQKRVLSSSEPTRIGEYEIRRELGRGGMGVVFEAVQLGTQRKVALKLISPAGAVSEQAMGLFVREACILAQLKHPRIVESLEFGMHNRQFFLAMEFVETVDFIEVLGTQSRPSQIRLACGIASRILEALHFAHQRGVVHRDVKPANILTHYVQKKLSAKLADFGLAKNYTNAGFSAISDDEDMKGTLAYIAPEQIINCRYAKPPCDIYSAGAALYYFLTGHTPHDFDDSQSAIATLLNMPTIPIQQRDPKIPDRLAQVVDRSLARKPEDRFDSAQEFQQALAEFVRKKRP